MGFWFSSRASSGPFGWIFDRKVRKEAWIVRPFSCEVSKQSDAIFWGKIAPALEPFQSMDSAIVLLLLGTVKGELEILQNRISTWCNHHIVVWHYYLKKMYIPPGMHVHNPSHFRPEKVSSLQIEHVKYAWQTTAPHNTNGNCVVWSCRLKECLHSPWQ